MVVWAKKEWVPALKRIWKECFGDEDWYIDFYFENRFLENNMLVWLEEGIPAAMASLLPCVLWEENSPTGRKTGGRYIYGVATKPEFQGRGISTKLMEYILNYLKEKEEVGILVPAGEYLKAFYGKRGFFPGVLTEETQFFYQEEKQEIFQAASLTHSLGEKDFKPAEAEEYKNIRDHHFGQKGYVEWDQNAIAYGIEENRKIGGEAYVFSLEGERHILMVLPKKEEGKLIVRESTLSKDLWEGYGSRIGVIFQCNIVVGKGLYTMSTSKNWKKGYFNLALD